MRMKRVLALTMAALMCASTAQAELKKGDRGGKVLQVQDELHARGYLADEGDGQYGKQTEDAVKAFQQENELEATGVVDDETLDRLMNDGEASSRKAQKALEGLGYSDISVFQKDNGLTVTGELDADTEALLLSDGAKTKTQQAQERLKSLGYLQGEADGAYGDRTREAVAKFQQANGLEVTGELDADSREALMSDSAVGDAVRMVQQRLIDLGYLEGSADGQFGERSVAALKAFQQNHGLEVTDESDEATRSMLFSDAAKVVYPALNSTSTNAAAVKKLQQRLIDLGFLSDKADGDYGSNTYSAVLEFQQHLIAQGESIEATGEATSETQERLFAEDYSTYISDLTLGAEGAEVLRVERRLRSLGYMDASANESYDDYAVECVKAFQEAAGLEVTGTADKAVVDALFSAGAPEAAQYVLHDVAKGETAGVIEYAQNALIRMGMFNHYQGMATDEYDSNTDDALNRLYDYLIQYNSHYAELFAAKELLPVSAQKALMNAELVVYVEDVQEGAQGSEIERVQRRLRGLFYDVTIDGDYGSGTRAAVEAFQQNNGLEVTGVADAATQARLYSDAAVGNWTDNMLKVSIDEQKVYAYTLNDEKQYELVDTFICSTGLGNSTPKGVFSSTTEPLDRWHYFVKYKCWAQYAWRITGNIYFHSVIFSEQDEDTLRMSSVYNLGSKASHGCIRLKVEDAKWIYQNCNAGTIVIIS